MATRTRTAATHNRQRSVWMPASWYLALVAIVIWTQVVIAASSTSLAVNTSASDWWTEDHPYYYKFRYKRLANGSIVLNDNYASTVADIRKNISARQPAAVKWIMKKETRKAIKDVNRFLLYNFVPSAVFGDVMTKLRAKTLQKEMRNTFLLHNVAIPGLKMIGEFIWKVLKNHYGSLIEREQLYKRLQSMTIEQISEEFHVPIPEYDRDAELEAQRPNHTLPYTWKGRMQIFNGFGARFVPYADYALQYYSPDDDLPPPVLPAASYPWLWSEHLAMVRELMLQIMMINARHVDNEFSKMLALADKDDGNGSSQSAASNGSSGIEDNDKMGRLQSITQSPLMSAEQQRRARLDALKEMTTVAFEGELKALRHGLQTPSSIWYAMFDRSIDELADAIVGFVNATLHSGDDVTPLHVYSTLVQDTTKRSIFFLSSSYFSTTNLDTNLSMKIRKKVPMLEVFTEVEQIELITLFADKMRQVDDAIEALVDERAARQEYQSLVNATMDQVLYQGSQYSTLEFGFLAPATNKQNVLYRDVRRPVPFHLVLRLFVRFQESRLLLPEESYHMLACLAMLRNEISYYRCRPTNE
uniref:Transmembrane protein n=1 Tax=Globisporangium ultimum (strain ATCC 200006 / CBS 805.95 / DAOM BR144) TaxID=431595 RepID=K3X3N4_GLOUD